MRATVALAIGVVLGAVVMAQGTPPGPVRQNLGEINPTPAPTGPPFEKQRMITTLTVQNTEEGETQIMFEAVDLGEKQRSKRGLIAAEQYTMTLDSPEYKGHRDRVLKQLRSLEQELLDYVEVAGPPKERSGVLPGSQRPR